MTDKVYMWEILVPTMRRLEGTPYRTRYHRVWDDKVKAITNGLTIYSPVKGVWVSASEDTYRERMIPVRIMATEEQMVKIGEMTKIYYDQLAVLIYRVGDHCITI